MEKTNLLKTTDLSSLIQINTLLPNGNYKGVFCGSEILLSKKSNKPYFVAYFELDSDSSLRRANIMNSKELKMFKTLNIGTKISFDAQISEHNADFNEFTNFAVKVEDKVEKLQVEDVEPVPQDDEK